MPRFLASAIRPGRIRSTILLSIITIFLLARLWHLDADFPNHCWWSDDQARFTDEGWYASGAINTVLTGHWYLPGDWSPTVVVPFWTANLEAVFHFTGVSIVAARALEVAWSWLVIPLAYLLFRKAGQAELALPFAALVSVNSMSFFFSRLALLEAPLTALVLASLVTAFSIRPAESGENQRWANWLRSIFLGVFLVAAFLTKTTIIFLLPAIFYPLFANNREAGRIFSRRWIVPAAIALSVLILGVAVDRVLLVAPHLADYKNFFAHSAPGVSPKSIEKLARFFFRVEWVDPFLFFIPYIAVLCALIWLRGLWRNPLFCSAFLWIAGYGGFIVLHFDAPPRYFGMLAIPVLMLTVLFAQALYRGHRRWAWALIGLLCISIAWNVCYTAKELLHPEYTLENASFQIKRIIDAHPESPRLVMGHGTVETTLYTRIPVINDEFGSLSEREKLEIYRPGWVLIWSDEGRDSLQEVSSRYRMIPMGRFPALDQPERSELILYQLVPRSSRRAPLTTPEIRRGGIALPIVQSRC